MSSMAITPVELVPLTAACTLGTTVAAMVLQRFFSRQDAERETERRRLEAVNAEALVLFSIPIEQAVRRQETARLELLRLFTDVQADVDVRQVQCNLGVQEIPTNLELRDVLRATQVRHDDDLQHSAAPWLEQLTSTIERELLGACADIVTHWDEFDNLHNFGWSSKLNIARGCAHYATRVIGAALRCEPLPVPPYSVLCRLPQRAGEPALRASRDLFVTYWMLIALGASSFNGQHLPLDDIPFLDSGKTESPLPSWLPPLSVGQVFQLEPML